MRLRPATATDLPFLRAMLYEATWWDPAADRPGIDAGLAIPEIAAYLAGFPAHAERGLVAFDEDSDEPIGAAWWRYWKGGVRGYGFAGEEIPEVALAVVPPERGRGAGTHLLQALMRQAESEGIDRLSLSVSATNPARRLYERLGFEAAGGSGGSITMVVRLRA